MHAGVMPGQLSSVIEPTEKQRRLDGRSDGAGYAAGLLSWLIGGSVFAPVKLDVSEMPPWTFCFLRALMSGLILLPLVSRHYCAMLDLLRRRGLEAAFVGAIGLGLT